MDCKKCGSPMYHPSPNKLCPQCDGVRIDEYIAKQEAAQPSVQRTGWWVCQNCGTGVLDETSHCQKCGTARR